MIVVQFVLVFFVIPIALILIGIGWLWCGKKAVCWIFTGG
jgi:hypothetical protein